MNTRILALCAAFSLPITLMAQTPSDDVRAALTGPDLTVERVYASPSLSGPTPSGVQFSPDGRSITYLKGKDEDFQRQDLWIADLDGSNARMLIDSRALEPEDVALSAEEEARRERQRIRATGIVSYSWDKQGKAILLPVAGDIYLADPANGSARALTQTDAFETDAQLSPKGGYVGFIRDRALHVVDIATGHERQISPDATDTVSWGMAEFVAQEEMDRDTGYWFSPDDRFVAYARVDVAPVDIVERFEIGADGVEVVAQRYPRAGRPNAQVSLFIQDLATGETATANLGDNPDIYLARVNWSASTPVVYVGIQNRAQTRLTTLAVHAPTGAATVFDEEVSDTWINLSHDFRALKSGAVVTTDETTGFRHIRVKDTPADTPRYLTSGDWAVEAILSVNEDTGAVYFSGYKDTPLERHIYRVSMTDGFAIPVRLTERGKSWSASFNADASAFIGTASSAGQPPQVGLYSGVDGTRLSWIEENRVEGEHPYAPFIADHRTPEYGTIEGPDGTELFYEMLTPPGFDPDKRYPAIIYVYGGPHVQLVRRAWGNLLDQVWARQGYVVFTLDNRGSDNRGKAFETALHRRMGTVEVEDQLAGLAHLKSLAFIDPDRIGITGWSYGGYMALMTVLKAPEGSFAAAISGAPVTDWALYDTHYTERYMGMPQDNPEGYSEGSAFPFLDTLSTPILMIHGMADDNVTFDNSTRVYAALQEKGIPFEMMTYPGQKHRLRGETRRVHLAKTQMAFFARHLRPGE